MSSDILETGDWVQLAYPPLLVFQIKTIRFSTWSKKAYCTDKEGHEYYAEDLRKITKEEIEQHKEETKTMNTKDSESEIHEIANQISFFLGKHNTSLDNLKRLHQKFYDLEDCMKSILWDEEIKRRKEEMLDYMVEFTVKTTFTGKMVVSAPDPDEADRKIIEEEDMEYDNYLEITVPTIKVLKVEKIGDDKYYDY